MPRRLLTAEDLWTRVDVQAASVCWPYLGSLATNGYGQMYFDGRRHMAHRVAYELTKGRIPEGLAIDHLCRNRACCNPGHLEAVTPLENSRRAPAWKGNLTHCPQGHPYTGDNLYVRPTDGARICVTCRDRYSLRAKRRRRAAFVADGLTTRGTPRVRPQSARDGGPGCPGGASPALTVSDPVTAGPASASTA